MILLYRKNGCDGVLSVQVQLSNLPSDQLLIGAHLRRTEIEKIKCNPSKITLSPGLAFIYTHFL